MTPITLLIDALTILACAIAVSGCGKEELTVSIPTPEPTAAADSTPVVVATATPTPTPTITPPTPLPIVSLTVYSRTIIIVTTFGGFDDGMSLYGTGYCTIYNGVTYCWDDGIKRFPHQSGEGGFTYWALTMDTQHYSNDVLVLCPNFYGYCVTDRLLAPTTMTPAVAAVLEPNRNSTAYRTIAQVLAGTSQQVSCTDDGAGTLSCGSFSIDTNQVGLQ